MHNDHLSDFATRLRNASKVGKKTVTLKSTKLIEAVAEVLVANSYLVSSTKDNAGNLALELCYVNSQPAINSIKRISTPGCRIYHKSHDLTQVLSGLGIGVISTSKGIMDNKQAIKQKIGGEVLLELW
jgi:small subunit ribosomal protein S8